MLWYRLAWQFGRPVAELQEQMSQAEFLEWAQYLAEIPGGDEWASWRAALVASTVAQAHCGSRANQFPIKDFMPTPASAKPQHEVTDWRAMKRMITGMGRA
jgi:beta-mannanase